MSRETVQPGKFVSLTYVIRDLSDNVLEQNDLPTGYVHGGDRELIGGLDQAIIGKGEGDEVEITVSPVQGFGDHDPNLTFTDDLANVPPEFRHLGAEVQMQNSAGDLRTFYVTHIEEGRLTVDGNHPLAGKTLRLSVRIHEVRDPSPADLNPAAGSCMIN